MHGKDYATLASAVCFTDYVSVDYIQVNCNRYVVCAPTYVGIQYG